MQFQVPQFIEVEDKIFGPLTAKQFFYLLGGGAVLFLLYVFFELWIVILFGAPIAAFAGFLAFLKVNGMPFIKVLNNGLNYIFSNRLYLWKKIDIPRKKIFESKRGKLLESAPSLTKSKLQDLAWSLDIHQELKR